MSIELCHKKAKNRVSYVCIRAGELRKGKTRAEISQKEAFKKANKEAAKLKF
jgi:hypothetical protein